MGNLKKMKDRYAKLAAEGEDSVHGESFDPMEISKFIGYSEQELRSVPAESVMGLGCGNPFAFAEIEQGQRVLDLGSGGGLDVFLAARKVGPTGLVIGVDEVGEMVERARQSAARGGFKNVEFRRGRIESLPVEENSVDVVLSNCVLNHCADKAAAFGEVRRVLRPGGAMFVSDLVLADKLSEDLLRSASEVWREWLAAALPRGEYLGAVERAGLRDLGILFEKTIDSVLVDEPLRGKIISLHVSAKK